MIGKSLFLVAALLGISSCARTINVGEVLESIRESTVEAYGRADTDPIRLGISGDPQWNIGFARYYLSCLMTRDGQRLSIVSRGSKADPMRKSRGIPGPSFLDVYRMAVGGTTDTISLFIDIYYYDDSLLTPSGLYFVPPDQEDAPSNIG